MATYSLGSHDAELARLEAQAEFLRRPTETLLRRSGLTPGMRVLDLGTGLGHVATAVAELVGPDGEVVGLDRDSRMLELAADRTARLPQVRLCEGDVETWRDDRPFDAVVGRLILFHLPDPVATLRHHLAGVRAGGRVVVLDYDLGGLRAEPPDGFTDWARGLVVAAFRAVGADPTIGSRLQSILAGAGAHEVDGFGVAQYLGADDPRGPAMLAGVVGSLAPAILGHGLATEAELDLPTLAQRSAAALQAGRASLVPPLLVGAWGERR